MAKPIGLAPRGQSKQVRICIPKDLWDVYGGRKDFRISLGNLAGPEAKVEAHRLRALKDAEFAQKRRELARVDSPIKDVPPELARVLAEGVYAMGLEQDDHVRESGEGQAALVEMAEIPARLVSKALSIGPGQAVHKHRRSSLDGLTDGAADALQDLNALADAQAAINLARRNLLSVQPVAEAVARRMGLSIDWSSEGGRQALKACLEQQRKAWKDRAARDAGEVIPTPGAPTAAQALTIQSPAKTHRLSEVLDKWAASGDNPSEATVRKKRVSLRMYEEFTHNQTIETLTKEQGGEFSGWLLKQCKAEKTAKDHLDGVKALLNSAVGLGWLQSNPWQGHRVKVKKTRPRRPWTAANLCQLFDSPLFAAYQLPTLKHAGGAAAYWVPLLGIYTGARQSDLCQLRTMDVEEEGGGLFIHITSDAEDEDEGILGTSMKTLQGRRKLPVHSALMALGFGDYWRDVKLAGHAALFPGVHRVEGRPAGEQFSKWFSTYRKAQGITARYVDFHGFRHTVSTRLMGAGVPDSASNYITGHSGTERGSSGTYKHMDTLRDLMERLSYPELSLSRVYVARDGST